MQADKKNLSKREKRLVMLLAVVGLFAVMVMYVIIPLFNKLEDKINLHDTMTIEKGRIEASIATEVSIRDALDTAASEHGKLMANYISESHMSDIGRMLTGLCENHRLSPIDQKLSSPKPLFPGDKADDDGDAEASSAFLAVTAAMTVSGGYRELKSLLDTVEKTDYIRVVRVSFGRSDPVTSEFDRIMIYFEVKMLKDIAED